MRILFALLALGTLLPLPVAAYVTPEEMLDSGDFIQAPDTAPSREVDETDVSPIVIEEQHNAAPDDDAIDWVPDGSTLTPEERRDARVIDRVNRTRIEQQDNTTEILRGSAPAEPLHGGAPLAPTGMGTIVLLLSSAAAIGYTLRKARQTS